MGHPVKFACPEILLDHFTHNSRNSRNKIMNKQLTVICGFGAHYLVLNVLIFGFTLKITILNEFQEKMWNRYQLLYLKFNFHSYQNIFKIEKHLEPSPNHTVWSKMTVLKVMLHNHIEIPLIRVQNLLISISYMRNDIKNRKNKLIHIIGHKNFRTFGTVIIDHIVSSWYSFHNVPCQCKNYWN